MTLPQQDQVETQARRFQPPAAKPGNGLVEIVRKTSDGYDVRTGETFYKTERLGVYSSRQAALEAVLAKYAPDLSIEPLKVNE